MSPYSLVIITFIFLLNNILYSQDVDSNSARSVQQVSGIKIGTVQTFVDTPASFPGGMDSMLKYISLNLNYPQEALDIEVEGTVYISVVINANGQVKNAKLLKGLAYGCDEEALRIVSGMPDWKPAYLNGKPVASQQSVPVHYKAGLKKRDSVMVFDSTFYAKSIENPDCFRMPEYPGGLEEIYKNIYYNIQYPANARDRRKQGIVYVQFVIEMDGRVSNVEAIKGPGFGLNEEAVRCIKSLPRFLPALYECKPITIYYNMPIKFSLN